MRTFELTSNFYRTIFNIHADKIESHIDLFDTHEGGNLFPSKRKIIDSEQLGYMGIITHEQFIEKVSQSESNFREISGSYAEGINRTYEENRERYPLRSFIIIRGLKYGLE